MKYRIAMGLLLLGNNTVYATKTADVYSNIKSKTSSFFSEKQFIATLTGGADFVHIGQARNVSLLPPFSTAYESKASYANGGSVGFGLGMEGAQSEMYFWQLGLAGFYHTPVTNTGAVLQFNLPAYNNFIYRYRIQATRAVVTGKLLGTLQPYWHPYVSGEIGAAFNTSSGYHDTPLLEENYPMAPYANNTQTAFTWSVGFGVDAELNNHLRLGVGYQFVDLGKASLGFSSAQETRDHLDITNLFDHQIRAQLTLVL